MPWKLFIDDERMPPLDGSEWVIARSYYEVGNLLYDKNMPNFVSFDHDLGEYCKTGYDIAKYMVECDMSSWYDRRNMLITFPKDFSFCVHSQNPVGKKNIEGYLDQYLKMRDMV